MGIDTNSSTTEVPFKVTNPEQIPARRYYDEGFFKLESELFWPRVWQMACRLEEIPEVGDWVEYKILDKSVLIVHTNSGVKAFHNACRHRGVQLVSGQGSCKSQGFTCPFHGWRWNIDGDNIFVLGRHLFSEESLRAAELNLKSCRVEFWGGCAFINFDDKAAPLLDCLGSVTSLLNHRNVDQLKVEWWSSAILPTNWKLAMEAFMEGYHTPRTHPQLNALSPPGSDRYTRNADGSSPPPTVMTSPELVDLTVRFLASLSEGMAGMVHENDVSIARDIQHKLTLSDNPQVAMGEFFGSLNAEITLRGRARGVPMPDLNELAVKHPTAPVQFMFPHYFLLPFFGNMSSYRIRPLTAETCLFEIWSLVLYPEGEKRERPVAPTPMAHDDKRFPPIPQQDYSNLPLQQRGLHAGGFEYMRLSRNIEGMISNYQRVLDGFLGGVPQDKLVNGMQLASGSFDSPVKDLGF